VLEPVAVGPNRVVRLAFVWLLVYLDLFRRLQHPLSGSFEPMGTFLASGAAFQWQEFEEFNCLFLAFRLNLLRLKQQLQPWTVKVPNSVSIAELFRGAGVSSNVADRLVLLPSSPVSIATISGALSDSFPQELQPKDDIGNRIDWENGLVVVRNVPGAPADHFLVLNKPPSSPAPAAPYLAHGQEKYTETGDPFTPDALSEEITKCQQAAAVTALAAMPFDFLFSLFANRPAAADFDIDHLPPSCIVVLAEQCAAFYGFTFFERAKFTATMSISHIVCWYPFLVWIGLRLSCFISS
jgi:hypothetical protein